MKRLIPAVYFVMAIAAVTAIAAKPSGPFVLVVTSPAKDAAGAMAVIDRAEGSFVSAGRLPWLSVAHSQAPDFPARLLDAGALLVINHDLAFGCLQGANT